MVNMKLCQIQTYTKRNLRGHSLRSRSNIFKI